MKAGAISTRRKVKAGLPGNNILGVAYARKLLILCVALLGSGLGYLYFLRCPPVYQSSAQVLIIKKDSGLPVQGMEQKTTPDDAVSMHTLLLRSPTIAAKAIEKHHLASLPSFRNSDNPIGLIVGGLGVDCKTSGSTSVLTLTFRGSDNQDCPKVLDAMVKTYQAFLGETYQNSSAETAQLITQAKDVLLRQLNEKEAAYQEFREKTPLLWKGEAGANLHETRMAEIETNRSRLMVLQAETRSKIEAIDAAIKKGNRKAAAFLIAGFAAGTQAAAAVAGGTSPTATAGHETSPTAVEPGALLAQPVRANKITSLEDLADNLALEEQLLLEEYGPDHPRVRVMRKKRELLQERIAATTKAALKTVDGQLTGKPIDFIDDYLESLHEELVWQQEEARGLDELFQQERDAARGLSEYQVRDEGFRNEIGRTQQLFNVVIKRLDEINLVKDSGGVKTNVVSAPEVGQQIAPKLANAVGMGGFLGALAAFILGCVVEVLNTQFRTPDDIRGMLGLEILGHIPVLDVKPRRNSLSGPLAALSPTLCVVHHPKGTNAEAYRLQCTAIYFNAHAADQKIIQITSPNVGDGKSITSTNRSDLHGRIRQASALN